MAGCGVNVASPSQPTSEKGGKVEQGDIGNKEKYASFPGGLAQDGALVYRNEPGQMVYWPTGPGIAIYYKIDWGPVRGGIVVMAKIDSDSETLKRL